MLGPELGFGTTLIRELLSLSSRSFQYSERDRCINSDMEYENFSVVDICGENLLKMRPEWWAGMRWTMNAELILEISTKPNSGSTDQAEWMQVNPWNIVLQVPCCARHYCFSFWILRGSKRGPEVGNRAAEGVSRGLRGAVGIKVFTILTRCKAASLSHEWTWILSLASRSSGIPCC